MDSIDALSRSRCHERRLNNKRLIITGIEGELQRFSVVFLLTRTSCRLLTYTPRIVERLDNKISIPSFEVLPPGGGRIELCLPSAVAL